MRAILAVLLSLSLSLILLTSPGQAKSHNLSDIIESFVLTQFPDATSHFWVVNGTQWQEENELVVDLNTIVLKAAGQVPTENRYLLLIVSGKLAGAQHIPLDAAPECQPEAA